jgi:FMN reductase
MEIGEKVRVVGLCGSLRPGSHTRAVVEAALAGADETGSDTALLDLRDYQLVFCDGKDDESGYPDDVERLRESVRSAQGLILGSPEYHGSFSGVIKNALDLMGSDELNGKIVGLVGVSGGQMGASGALSGLRQICRSVHAWAIPHQASIPQAWNAIDDNGRITDEGLRDRVMDVGRQVARYAYLHNASEIQDLVARWEGSETS